MASISVLQQLTRAKAAAPLPQNGLSSVLYTLCCGLHQSAATFRVKAPLTQCIIPQNCVSLNNRPATFLFNYQPHRNAGHSKWANIKHVKQANDQARAKEMTKYVTFMKVAVREHGSADPKQNSKLAQIIAQVKEAKLPMATIDRALQSLQAKKDNQHCIYPIRGPGNCVMLCDIESSNLMKTKQQLNTVLKKNKAIATDDSVLYMFEHKGLLLCSEIDGKPVSEESLDAAMEHAIEAGASDVVFHADHPEFGKVLEFTTEPSAFFRVKGTLENLKYSLAHAEVAYIPKQYMELQDEDFEAANKLYEKLTDHPDVQSVFVNIA